MTNIPPRLDSATLGHEADQKRSSVDPEQLARAIVDQLFYLRAALPEHATQNDWFLALAYAVRDRILDKWVRSSRIVTTKDVRTVAYLSAEFLVGPLLGTMLVNLGIVNEVRAATELLGLDLDRLVEHEEEPGLGNGGLGRLAACFMESLATLEVPATGYGIRYEFGIFDQEIRDGWQVEITDKWLAPGNPWEVCRPEQSQPVGFGGRTEVWHDDRKRYRVRWTPARVVRGIPHDTLVAGYRVSMVNVLRLWKAEAVESFDFSAFNTGDYYGAVERKVVSENLTKVLYPNDEPVAGKQLRLEQQYFLVACSLADMIRQHFATGGTLDTFDRGYAVQLNDTHPAIAVAELMRLLVDQYLLDWGTAWSVTGRTLSYTNHTLLPEALEQWPLPLFAAVLPRHFEIICEINQRFLTEVRSRYPGDEGRVQRMSIIGEAGSRTIRMAHLASVGCHHINGVAALHTELLKKDLLHDFYEMWPERFTSITNGVTMRRWLLFSNPDLTALITGKIGDGWTRDARELRRLEPWAEDSGFRTEWHAVKRTNKVRLAALIAAKTGLRADADSLFDVQVKRFHEYKRQHLNVLHVITLFNRLRRNPGAVTTPRTVIFGGKAAPGYAIAKLVIRLVHGIADVVNGDRALAGRLAVVFVPDFNVKHGHHIYPAADLSEQISTAGKEASGTGNMKFAINGALTIGTLDGANVEIRDAVGPDNFFLFGKRADEIAALRAQGYRPSQWYERDAELREAIDQIRTGVFSRGDPSLFQPLVRSLLERDEYFVLCDYRSYVDAQEAVAAAFRDEAQWSRMSILNVARSGEFSSDRAILEYCERIWKTHPLHIE